LNLALTPRSAGSTLKPFLYLEGIDRRILTAATLLPDTAEAIRSTYADYDPQNYNGRFLGPVRLREALGNSLNVPAVVALERIGAREVFSKLGTWGLKFPHAFDDYGAGFILGNAEVTLVDLAGAYAGIARRGEAWRPTVYVGEPVDPVRAASEASCAIVTDILCDNEARRLSFGNASPLDVGQRVAVKTGTSSGFRDGWCVGFTGDHTVAVWAGNPDGTPMNGTLAVKSAAPVWNAIVQHLLAAGDKPLPLPDETPGLVALAVAKQTGLLPRPAEPSVREWFLDGTAPSESSGSMYVREGQQETLMLPTDYAAWCAGPHNRLGAKARPAGLRILFPKDGAVFSYNPNLPSGQQILLPKSTDPGCEWYANGERLADARLPLRPGRWTLTAKSAGREESATIRVE
jgi:penicillin-binding protein 1C